MGLPSCCLQYSPDQSTLTRWIWSVQIAAWQNHAAEQNYTADCINTAFQGLADYSDHDALQMSEGRALEVQRILATALRRDQATGSSLSPRSSLGTLETQVRKPFASVKQLNSPPHAATSVRAHPRWVAQRYRVKHRSSALQSSISAYVV